MKPLIYALIIIMIVDAFVGILYRSHHTKETIEEF